MSFLDKTLKTAFLIFFFATIVFVGIIFSKIMGVLMFTKIMSVVMGIGLTLLFATEGLLVGRDCWEQKKWPWKLKG